MKYRYVVAAGKDSSIVFGCGDEPPIKTMSYKEAKKVMFHAPFKNPVIFKLIKSNKVNR